MKEGCLVMFHKIKKTQVKYNQIYLGQRVHSQEFREYSRILLKILICTLENGLADRKNKLNLTRSISDS